MKAKNKKMKAGSLCKFRQGTFEFADPHYAYVRFGPKVITYDGVLNNKEISPKYTEPYLTKIPLREVEYFYELNENDETVNKLSEPKPGCKVEVKPFRLGDRVLRGGYIAVFDDYKTIVLPSEFNVLA